MRESIILSILIFSFIQLYSQDNIPDLITDRPDQTESSISVPHKSFQIETGFAYFSDKSDDLKLDEIVYNSTLLRYGIFKSLELRLAFAFDKLTVYDVPTDTLREEVKGFIPFEIGTKINMTKQNRWVPELALLFHIAIPKTGTGDYITNDFAPLLVLSGSYTITDELAWGFNLGAIWPDLSSNADYRVTTVLGFTPFDKVGFFVEYYGTFIKENLDLHNFDGGITWSVLPNLQLDASAGFGLNETAIDYFISCGLSYRIPH